MQVVLLREGAVEILLKACVVPSQTRIGDESSAPTESNPSAMGRWLWIARAFTALCDPDISLTPSSPLSRYVPSQKMQLAAYLSCAKWTLKSCQIATKTVPCSVKEVFFS